MEMTAMKKQPEVTKLLPTKNEVNKMKKRKTLKNIKKATKVKGQNAGSRTSVAKTVKKGLRAEAKAKLDLFLNNRLMIDNYELRQQIADDLHRDEEYLKVERIKKRKKKRKIRKDHLKYTKSYEIIEWFYVWGIIFFFMFVLVPCNKDSTEIEHLDEEKITYCIIDDKSEYVNENVRHEQNVVETVTFETSNSKTWEEIYAENADNFLAPLEYTEEEFTLFYSVAYGECGAETDECKLATMEEIKYGIIKRANGDFAQEIRFPDRYSCVMEDGRILCGQGIVTPEIVPEEFKQMARDVLDGKYEDTIKFMSSYLAWCLFKDKDEKAFTSGDEFAEYYGLSE